jgi:hypothetical protein
MQSEHRRGTEQRKTPRLPFEALGLRVAIDTGAGRVVRLEVCPRDISAGGISFLYARDLREDTPLLIDVPVVTGGLLNVEAKVVRCDQDAGIGHQVSAAFDKPVDLADVEIFGS